MRVKEESEPEADAAIDIVGSVAVGRLGQRPLGASEHTDFARVVFAAASLFLCGLGLIGQITQFRPFSAVGFFLYALLGFGSAVLVALGYRGQHLLIFSAPLGLALTLVVGTLLSTAGLWSVGPALFWLAVSASLAVHLSTVLARRSQPFPRWLAAWGHRIATNYRQVYFVPTDPLGPNRPLWLVRASAVSMALATALCLASALAITNLDPGWGGLLTAVSPIWYVGLALLIFAIVAGQRLGGIYAGLPVVLLQLVLTGTPSIVYNTPKYPWTIKQVGYASYILLHGSANPRINIYLAWPGLFSSVAWICKATSFTNVLQIARWWSPIIDIATSLAVYGLASRVLRNRRTAWLAVTVFVVGYTISDSNYFCSQSAALLLAIAIFTLVFRHRDEEASMSTASWFLLLAAAVAEAITHQLTPYMVTSALVVLLVFGRLRTKWAPAITLVPAVVWALAHYAYVNQYVSWRALFNIFANLSTPGLSSGGPPPGQIANVVRLFQGASAVLIGALALTAILRHRTRLHYVLAACAASAGSLLAANSYGNEADFRVVLFALPWLSILAATLIPRMPLRKITLWSVILVTLLPVYLVADMGLDFVYAGRAGDLSARRYFELHAPYGSTLITIGNGNGNPINLTGRFDQVNEVSYPEVLGYSKFASDHLNVSFQQFMSRLQVTVSSASPKVVGSSSEIYVLFTEQSAAFLAAYNYVTLKEYKKFEQQFEASPLWKPVLKTSSAVLLRLGA